LTDNNLRPTTRVARGATYVFIQTFLTALISVVYFVVLAHTLPQEDMGAFALLSFLLALGQTLGTFSLTSAAIRYISQHLAENNPEKAKAVVSRVLQVGLLSSAITFLLLFVPAELTSTLMFGQSGYAFLLRLLALCSIFTILQVIVLSFLQGLQKWREVSIISMAYTFIHVPLSIFLLLTGLRLFSVVLGWVIGLAITAIVGLALVIKHLGLTRKLYPIRPLLRFSLPLYFSASVGYFVGWVDQLVLPAFTSLETLGIYHVAVRASVVPTLFSSAIIVALFPQLSELYTTQGISSLRDAFRISVRYAVLIGFPLILGVAVLAYPTIILLAGSQYAEAALPLIIISFSAIVGAFGIATGPILLTLERTKIASLLSLISVLVELLLSYIALAILNLSMVGTAWARTFTAIVTLCLSLYVVSHYVPISFDKEAIWKASTASALMVLTIIGLDLTRMLLSPSSYRFLEIRLHLLPVYIIVGALAYFAAIILLKALKKQDLELIQEYLPSKLKWVGEWLRRIAKVE
jgi:O-antigen/teichoic acid export membrane protein